MSFSCRLMRVRFPVYAVVHHHVENNIKWRDRLSTKSGETMAILQTAGKIYGTMRALASLPVSGSITCRISESQSEFEGHLECFGQATLEETKLALSQIQGFGFSLASEYGRQIKFMELSLTQSCELTRS